MLTRLLIASVILISSPVFADELDRAQLNKDLKGINPTVVTYNGQKGIWFTTEDGDKILQLVEKKLPLALDIIDVQNKQVLALQESIDLYRKSSLEYKEVAEMNRKMFDTAMNSLPNLKPPTTLWYENHKFVYVMGVLSGIGVMVAASYIIKSIPAK